MKNGKSSKAVKPVDADAIKDRLIKLKIWREFVLKDLYSICGDDFEKKAEITRTANTAQREYDKTLILFKDLI